MQDKFKHLLAGAIVAGVVGLPAYLNNLDLFVGLWSATSSGIIAAGIKEWCDNVYDNEWSWKDFGFTLIGVAAMLVFILLLHFAKG